jgi:DNA-binding HxlR family transcriptional regulator
VPHERFVTALEMRYDENCRKAAHSCNRRHFRVTDRLVEHDAGNCMLVSDVLARVGSKWSILVIGALGQGPRRFNELKRDVQGVSQRMLTLTVRGLERDGLIARTVTPSIPPRVDYALTDLGRSLLEPVIALGGWAIANRAIVERARRVFDAEISV